MLLLHTNAVAVLEIPLIDRRQMSEVEDVVELQTLTSWNWSGSGAVCEDNVGITFNTFVLGHESSNNKIFNLISSAYN